QVSPKLREPLPLSPPKGLVFNCHGRPQSYEESRRRPGRGGTSLPASPPTGNIEVSLRIVEVRGLSGELPSFFRAAKPQLPTVVIVIFGPSASEECQIPPERRYSQADGKLHFPRREV